MKKIFIILVLICTYFLSNAQAPVGVPSSKTRWYDGGWVQSDSGHIVALRDTLFTPRFAGTMVFWQHAGVDTSFWGYDGFKWNKVGSGGSSGSQSWDDVMTVSPDFNTSHTSNFNNNNWVLNNLGEFHVNASEILFFNQYSFPTTDGTIDQVLATDGFGGLYWSDGSGGTVLDTSFRFAVLDSLNTPPVSPTSGDIYEVGTVPTGAWVGHVGDIAEWNGSIWTFTDPDTGDLLYNVATDIVSKWTGSIWLRVGKLAIHQGGDRYGVQINIGSNDGRNLALRTSGTSRMTFGSGGSITFNPLTGASAGIMGLSTTGVASNVQPGTGVIITSSLIRVDTATIHTSVYNDGRYLQNITGLVTAGSGISVTGIGTGVSPYVIAATGGGGEDLETTMDIGSVLTQDHTIDHTGFSLTATGLNQTWNADNVLRGAAVDSVAFTSIGSVDIQAGTDMRLKTVTGTFDAITRASFGYRTGTGDSVFFEAKNGMMRFIAPVTSNLSGNPAIKTRVRDTITGQEGWADAAGVALTTNQIGVGIANVLNSYSTFLYNGTEADIYNNGIGTTQTNGLHLQTSTVATAGAPQYPGSIAYTGSSWNTTSSAAISQGMRISFITYSGAAASNVGYLGFFHNNAGYSTTPTIALQSGKVLINSANPNTVSANMLDITEFSGSNSIILRDDGGVAARSFSVGSTGTLTIGTASGGNVVAGGFEGQLSTGSGGIANTNLFAAAGVSGSNSAFPGLVGSANLTNGRVGAQATTTFTLTANQNHSAFAVGPNAITKAATGTHDMFANMAVYGMTINSGASTLTKAATFVINGIATGSGAPAGAEDNLALWVYTGISRFGGEVLLRAGTTAANTAPLKFVSGTNLTAVEAGAMEFDGTDLFFSPSSTRLKFDLGLTGSATLDFASTGAGAVADLTITVTGAADGDVVDLGVPNGSVTATSSFTAWVSAANTVTVRFSPKATEDPASGTFKVRVTK